MTVFEYRALSHTHTKVRGTIAADSAREARDKLRTQGFVVETITPQPESNDSFFRFQMRPARYASQLSTAVRDLATLLTAGISLLESIDTLCLQFRGRFKSGLLNVREQIANGTSLSEAMARNPQLFDDLTVQMVRVGENAGTLEVVLDRLADFRERYLQFKDRIVASLIYPTIVVLLAIGVSMFLMTVVLPMLLENLVEAGRPLPWPTRVLKAMSDFVTSYLWLVLAIAALTVVLLMAYIRTETGRRKWHQLVFSIPLLGALARKQEISRLAIVVSTLMKNGIVFVDAVDIACRVSKNLLMRDALDQIKESVRSGQELGGALEATRAFPPMVVQIFIVGQQTGQLEEMLDRLSGSYDREVASATTKLAAALEPLLIIVLALFIGFILFATILPILEAGNVF